MTPINSAYDNRIALMFSMLMDTVEDLALHEDTNPEQILSDKLFERQKELTEKGTDLVVNKLVTNYPMLHKAIT